MTRIVADWLDDSAVQAVCAAVGAKGAQALFVGGCVRNALLKESGSDIDIATDARPDDVMKLAEAAGLKAVPTGIDHGTITVVAEGQGFEVTTFRRDVATDGRRAVVAFSADIAEDAARRDFTMNALYARPDGTLIDPLDGLPDLNARRLRFIGDAETRIREDYLRILRFFRFHAWYADQSHGFDPEALSAIAATLDGLASLSKERVGSEMIKLLSAPDPSPELAVMAQLGVLQSLLPGADAKALPVVVYFEQQLMLPNDPIRRLASLGLDVPVDTLRLSRAQTGRLEKLRQGAGQYQRAAEIGYWQRDLALDTLVLRSALDGSVLTETAIEIAKNAASQSLPVSARDLMPEYQGAALGARLRQLETAWLASDFSLSRAELLDLADDAH